MKKSTVSLWVIVQGRLHIYLQGVFSKHRIHHARPCIWTLKNISSGKKSVDCSTWIPTESTIIRSKISSNFYTLWISEIDRIFWCANRLEISNSEWTNMHRRNKYSTFVGQLQLMGQISSRWTKNTFVSSIIFDKNISVNVRVCSKRWPFIGNVIIPITWI